MRVREGERENTHELEKRGGASGKKGSLPPSQQKSGGGVGWKRGARSLHSFENEVPLKAEDLSIPILLRGCSCTYLLLHTARLIKTVCLAFFTPNGRARASGIGEGGQRQRRRENDRFCRRRECGNGGADGCPIMLWAPPGLPSEAGRQARPTPAAAAEIQTVASFIPPPSLISISPLRSAPQNNRVWTACRPMGPDCSSLGDTVMRNELCSAEILSVFRSVRLRLQILKRDPSRPLN